MPAVVLAVGVVPSAALAQSVTIPPSPTVTTIARGGGGGGGQFVPGPSESAEGEFAGEEVTPAAGDGAGLPVTGSDILLLSGLGLGAVGIGLASRTAGRRRARGTGGS